jgi:hypothetical protein
MAAWLFILEKASSLNVIPNGNEGYGAGRPLLSHKIEGQVCLYRSKDYNFGGRLYYLKT